MVDLDFNAKRREEVFTYLHEKYKDGFAHIGTHGTLQPKNSFKDVCRVFGVPFVEANQLSSLIPDDAKSIDDALLDERFLKKVEDSPQLAEVIKYSKKLEGTIKSYGVHASFGFDAELVTKDGVQKIGNLRGKCVEILTPNGWRYARIKKTGHKKVIKYRIKNSQNDFNDNTLNVTDNHSILTGNLNWLEAKDFNGISFAKKTSFINPLYFLAGLISVGGYKDNDNCYLYISQKRKPLICEYLFNYFKFEKYSENYLKLDSETFSTITKIFGNIEHNSFVIKDDLHKEEVRGFLAGIFSSNCTINNGRIGLKLSSFYYSMFCFNSLMSFGIKCSTPKIEQGEYFYSFDIDEYNSFKFLNLIGLIRRDSSEDILEMSIWDDVSNESYVGDVFDFEIFTELEHERLAYVNGVICHNCIAGNSKILVDGNLKKIEDVFRLYKDNSFVVKTVNGNKLANVIHNGRKNVYNLSLYGSDGKTLIDNISVTSDHRVYIAESNLYVPYKELKPDTFYLHSSVKDCIPHEMVNDYFMAGAMLPLIDTTKDSTARFVYSKEKLTEVDAILGYFYDGDYSKWGLFKNTPEGILNKIKDVTDLRSFNNVICFNFKSDKHSKNLYQNLCFFISGLFSSLELLPTRINYAFASKIKFSSSLKNLISNFLKRYDITIIWPDHEMVVNEESIIKLSLYHNRLPLISFSPDTYIFKESSQPPALKSVYDLSIITDDELSKNYIANSFNVHNCSAYESPVVTSNGVRQIGSLDGQTIKLLTPDGWKHCYVWNSGKKKVNTYKLGSSLNNSEFIRFTPDHLVQDSNNEWIPIGETGGNDLVGRFPSFSILNFLAGWCFHLGYLSEDSKSIIIELKDQDKEVSDLLLSNFNLTKLSDSNFSIQCSEIDSIIDKYTFTEKCIFSPIFKNKLNDSISIEEFRSWILGLFSSSSLVECGSIKVFLPNDINNWNVLNFVKNYLYDYFGIECSLFKGLLYNRKEKAILLSMNEINSFKFLNLIGLIQRDKIKAVKPSKVFLTKEGTVEEDVYEFSVINELNRDNKCAYVNGHVFSNCGVILSPVPLNETVPLFASDDKPVTMYDGETMEKLKFIKCDILGVKVLAIIDETIININKNLSDDKKIKSIYDIGVDDAETYEMLSSGDVSASFQLEGSSIAPYVEKCKPKNIDDISAILATIRPG